MSCLCLEILLIYLQTTISWRSGWMAMLRFRRTSTHRSYNFFFLYLSPVYEKSEYIRRGPDTYREDSWSEHQWGWWRGSWTFHQRAFAWTDRVWRNCRRGVNFYTDQLPNAVIFRLVDRIRGRRQIPSGIEYLVQLEGGPSEKDWTWLSEAAMKKDPPGVLEEWLADEALQMEEAVDLLYQPERIISRRKVKGVPHYLIKWKGYKR